MKNPARTRKLLTDDPLKCFHKFATGVPERCLCRLSYLAIYVSVLENPSSEMKPTNKSKSFIASNEKAKAEPQ